MLRITSILSLWVPIYAIENKKEKEKKNEFRQIYDIKLHSPKEKLSGWLEIHVRLWSLRVDGQSRWSKQKRSSSSPVTNEETISTDKGKDGQETEGEEKRRKGKKRGGDGTGKKWREEKERTLGFSKWLIVPRENDACDPSRPIVATRRVNPWPAHVSRRRIRRIDLLMSGDRILRWQDRWREINKTLPW